MKYYLLCAGEDSGDVLGESFVAAVVAAGFAARGTGGCRMVSAGLDALADYEVLPVSGFGDVLPHYFRLRRVYAALRGALMSNNCAGLIAIDYPGFNMRLCALAKRLGKQVLYVAPPQVWAWKESRARKLQGIRLAVLFGFERERYEALGCRAEILKHPFLTPPSEPRGGEGIFLFPGSRRSQAVRNLKMYLRVVRDMQRPVKIFAARESLVKLFENVVRKAFGGTVPNGIAVEVSAKESLQRREIYGRASCALAAPGTVTLELSLSGCPLVVATVPDRLTYALGSLFVKAKYFAMPNILLGRAAVREFICAPWAVRRQEPQIRQALEESMNKNATGLVAELEQQLQGGKSAAELFGEFVEGDAH